VPVEPVIDAISHFRRQYPKITFSVKLQSATKISERLIAGSTSLVFGRADIFKDFANQYEWLPATLHLACSEQTFHQYKERDLSSILSLPIVDTNKTMPTLRALLSSLPDFHKILENKNADITCRDRFAIEKLLKGDAIGALSIAANESLPVKIRVFDQHLTPKKIDTTFSCRKRSSRDLIETLFLEYILDYSKSATKPV
jgi:hypothetical protein